MKKLLVLGLIGLFVVFGSGLTVMQENLQSVGTTTFYEKDIAIGVGSETLSVYNQGTTSISKAIVADKTIAGPRMSITEKTSLVPFPPPPPWIPPPDPYQFMGMQWGPNSNVSLNGVVTFENTTHQTAFQQSGHGTYSSAVQGNQTITSLYNKQFAPASQQFLPVPPVQPIQWPTPPPHPIDP